MITLFQNLLDLEAVKRQAEGASRAVVIEQLRLLDFATSDPNLSSEKTY